MHRDCDICQIILVEHACRLQLNSSLEEPYIFSRYSSNLSHWRCPDFMFSILGSGIWRELVEKLQLQSSRVRQQEIILLDRAIGLLLKNMIPSVNGAPIISNLKINIFWKVSTLFSQRRTFVWTQMGRQFHTSSISSSSIWAFGFHQAWWKFCVCNKASKSQ